MAVETKPDPFYRNHLIRDAIGEALYDAMKEDPSIHLFGEGAHMKVHYDAPQIEREMLDRVHTLPISEDGNTNFAVGASLLGVKPVVDVITADFLYRSFDSIANTAAKLNFVASDGTEPRTIVIRAELLLGGPSTGQRPEALFTHIPGLNVVLPSTPRDAYGLMRTALVTPGVTLFFEDRMIADSETRPEDYKQGPEMVPFGRASFRKHGPKPTLTIVTYGLMRQIVESVLDERRIDNVTLFDLRTLYPLDWDSVWISASLTGSLLIIEPDVTYGGIGAELAARVIEYLPGVRIKRLGAPRETIPASRDGQARMMPSREQILEAIRGIV
jgi:pyruvate dehydrogenase E1 component beta subunit